jgi:propane 2-monooxygenase large subunit
MSAPRRRSVTKTHERIGQLGWDATHHQPVTNYPTRYRFPAKAKDPMKQIMREYLPMQLEKDERMYGGLDAAVRANMADKAERRWLEVLKPFVHTTTYIEGCAGRVMSMLMDTVPNEELLNGYHVQFVDELRHIGMQQSLGRWYAKNAPEPEGWAMGAKYYANSPLTKAGYNMGSHSIVGDPVHCGITMMTVLETAFTNIAFVALPDVGLRNGDFALPTTYSSAQSDEARHISNGYATLMTLLQEDSNIPLIKQDLASGWWSTHAFIDPFAGTLIEYFSKDRSDQESYLTKWDRWVNDDYYRSYIEQLGKLGLDMDPQVFLGARDRIVRGLIHQTAIFSFAIWPLAYWHFDALTERDFEWFEDRYPGWYDEYGPLWEGFAALTHPQEQALFIQGFLENAPPLCWSCMMSCLGDEEPLYRVIDGRTRFYCSELCKCNDEWYPGRYTGDRQFFDRYHGWDLAEVIRDIGFIKPDGKTLVGQPHIDEDKPQWTIDDIAACGCEVTSPNILTAERLGLPNGSWHDPSTPDGAVATSELSYVPRQSIGADGLETGQGVRSVDGDGNGRRNVGEVVV